MASKMLMNDLENLKQKYRNRMNYFDKKINNNYDPNQEKKLWRQYEYCVKAYHEIEVIIATHERVFK